MTYGLNEDSSGEEIYEAISRSGRLDVLTGLRRFNAFARSNNEVLTSAYEEGRITDESIEEAIREHIINSMSITLRGFREDYFDICSREALEVLAYCVDEGILSEEELKSVPYSREYLRGVSDSSDSNLLTKLRKNLLNPSEPERYDGYIDRHPACCGSY